MREVVCDCQSVIRVFEGLKARQFRFTCQIGPNRGPACRRSRCRSILRGDGLPGPSMAWCGRSERPAGEASIGPGPPEDIGTFARFPRRSMAQARKCSSNRLIQNAFVGKCRFNPNCSGQARELCLCSESPGAITDRHRPLWFREARGGKAAFAHKSRHIHYNVSRAASSREAASGAFCGPRQGLRVLYIVVNREGMRRRWSGMSRVRRMS
jgi:hypothetical protein